MPVSAPEQSGFPHARLGRRSAAEKGRAPVCARLRRCRGPPRALAIADRAPARPRPRAGEAPKKDCAKSRRADAGRAQACAMTTTANLPIAPDLEPLLPKQAIAAYYAVSVRTVERWMFEGCPSRRIGGVRRFCLAEVDEFLAELADRPGTPPRNRTAEPKPAKASEPAEDQNPTEAQNQKVS
jgi:hypothetical protein